MGSGAWIWVGLGGSIGSLCRYGIARWAGNRFKDLFPWGTLIVNGIGAFLLGFLQGSDVGAIWMLFFGTGVLGGLTTFSTWMMESLRLAEEGEIRTAALNIMGSVALGLLLFLVGYSFAGGHI